MSRLLTDDEWPAVERGRLSYGVNQIPVLQGGYPTNDDGANVPPVGPRLLTDAEFAGLKAPSRRPSRNPRLLTDDEFLRLGQSSAQSPSPTPQSQPQQQYLSDADVGIAPSPPQAPTQPVYLSDADVGLAPAPVATVPSSGILANSPNDSYLTGALKGTATALARVPGDIIGLPHSLGNFSDYLVARLESGITGKPLAQVQQEHAAARAAYEANATPIGKLASDIDPSRVIPAPSAISGPILAQSGAYMPTTPLGRAAQAGIETAVSGALSPGMGGPEATALKALVPVGAMGGLSQYATEATGDPLIGLATAALPGVAAETAGAALRGIPGKIAPETAELANAARNTYGIPMTAPQMSESPAMRFFNSAIEKLPLSGAGKAVGATQKAFNRAVSRTFGEDANKITPQVMASARDRIGNQFESAATKTPQIQIDPQFGHELLGTLTEAHQTLPASELAPINKQVSNILSKIDRQTNSISGETYQSLTRRGAPLDRAMQSPDPNVRFYAGRIRSALDSALERSAPQETLDDLRSARQQWRNMRTIEPLVTKGNPGDISPAALQSRVATSYKGTHGAAYGGGGDLKQLADIGQRFLKPPPSSGTAERMAAYGALGDVVGAVPYAFLSHEPMAAIAPTMGLGAALGAGRIAGGLLRSEGLANAVIDRSLGRPVAPGWGNYLLGAAQPSLIYAGGLVPPTH